MGREGASYEQHWAFIPPQKKTVPDTDWGHNEIDRFIHRSLLDAKLSPQKPASKEQLI